MTITVSSVSPHSMLAAGAAAQGAQPLTVAGDVAPDATHETSDFKAVLSPLMEAGDAAGAVLPLPLTTTGTGLELPAALVSGTMPTLPEGVSVAVMAQQSVAAKGNSVPAAGNALPPSQEVMPGTVAVVAGDPLLQIVPAPDVDIETVPATPDQSGGEVPAAAQQQDLLLVGAIPSDALCEPLAPEPAGFGMRLAESASTDVVPELMANTDTAQLQTASATALDIATVSAVAIESGLPVITTASVAPQFVTAANSPPHLSTKAQPAIDAQAETGLATAIAELPDHVATVPAVAETSIGSNTAGGDIANAGVRSAEFARLLEQSQPVRAGSDLQETATTLASAPGAMKSLGTAVAWRMDGQNPIATTLVQQPVDSPHWSLEVGERLVWFGVNRIQHAEIELDPPELGPLQVRISTHNDQTTVTFTSQHAAVRDVLDQSLPRLKEMFAEQGLNLVQADVGERRGSAQDHQAATVDGVIDDNTGDDADTGNAESPVVTRVSRSLVDAYA